MQVVFRHVDSGTALSLVPPVHAICHRVCFLLRGPKDSLSGDKGLFLGISFRVTDNLDRVSREHWGVKNKAVGDIISLRKMKAGKGTPPTGSPEDTLCPGNPSMNAVGAWVSGVWGDPATPRSAGSCWPKSLGN